MRKTVLDIPELSCRMCVRHVERVIEGRQGVSSVLIELAERTAVVEHSDDVPPESLLVAVAEAGYRARIRGAPHDGIGRV